MNLSDELSCGQVVLQTAIFQLTNDDLIIASFKEDEEQGKVYFVNPMHIIIFTNEQTGEEGLSLEPYIHQKVIHNPNFFLDKSKIFSVHQPTPGLFEFYAKKINSNMTSSKKVTKKGVKKEEPEANANNTVIHVDFKNRTKANSSLVNIYKEKDLNFVELEVPTNDGPDVA